MSLFRPEAKAALYRWREAIIGLALVGLGLRWVLNEFGALFLIGCGRLVAGTALLFAGLQRGRFRSRGGGLGLVEVDERQITYFGPFGGGAVAVAEIVELGVDPSQNWMVRDGQGTHLLIPQAATGGDALFDAFSLLPGLTGSELIEAVQSTPRQYTILWQKPQPRLH